jgi:hypothetical protein
MLGFKRFRRAATAIAGVELMRRIRKGSSNSASFASKTRPRPKFGTQFSPRDPRQASEHFLALIASICVTAIPILALAASIRRVLLSVELSCRNINKCRSGS